jgi:ER lumen protein retaining receptor
MLNDYKPTHDPNIDTFKVQYLLGSSALLALLFPHNYTFFEVCVFDPRSRRSSVSCSILTLRTKIMWAFSIWLEAVAILPQLFMLQRTGEAETITTHYLFALGIYRALYIPNWVYRYFANERNYPIAIIAGIIQTILYSDFFWIYYTKFVAHTICLVPPLIKY